MIKLALPAGKANPSPPVGPALGAKVRRHASSPSETPVSAPNKQKFTESYVQGVNIMAFCKDYNAATQDKIGTIIPVEITVFEVCLQHY